jgi:hypothetical protein
LLGARSVSDRSSGDRSNANQSRETEQFDKRVHGETAILRDMRNRDGIATQHDFVYSISFTRTHVVEIAGSVVLDPRRDRVKMGKFCGGFASGVGLTPGRFSSRMEHLFLQ